MPILAGAITHVNKRKGYVQVDGEKFYPNFDFLPEIGDVLVSVGSQYLVYDKYTFAAGFSIAPKPKRAAKVLPEEPHRDESFRQLTLELEEK